MPTIYPDASRVPELDGEVRGGVTVVMHQPDEIDGLLAICELAPRPPETPLLSVCKALMAPNLSIDEWQDYWRSTQSSLTVAAYDKDSQPSVDSKPNIVKLKETLRLARDLWQGQPDSEKRDVSCVAVIADHDPTALRKLEILGDNAVFALYQGSVIADIVRLPFYPMIFFVGLVAGGGATPAARVNGLVKRLRNSATHTQVDSPLQDIKTLRSSDLSDKPLVVLIHGLLSTDVGTFGQLETLLTEQNVQVAGFPHDSVMTSIDDNGRELAQVLCALKLKNGFARLACHSRGGLVARSAAAWLARGQSQSILGGCATFGTPHCGSPLAEVSQRDDGGWGYADPYPKDQVQRVPSRRSFLLRLCEGFPRNRRLSAAPAR